MINCEMFRAQFAPATEDPNLLTHLRSCDACLGFAVERDSDVLFRALGGEEIVPPGGVDAFVDDVMREVRLRGTENTVTAHSSGWPRRLAVAATVAATIAGATFMVEHRNTQIAPAISVVHHAVAKIVEPAPRPIIESYDSQKATIVEIPTEGEDVKVVMVFDDDLPADL